MPLIVISKRRGVNQVGGRNGTRTPAQGVPVSVGGSQRKQRWAGHNESLYVPEALVRAGYLLLYLPLAPEVGSGHDDRCLYLSLLFHMADAGQGGILCVDSKGSVQKQKRRNLCGAH